MQGRELGEISFFHEVYQGELAECKLPQLIILARDNPRSSLRLMHELVRQGRPDDAQSIFEDIVSQRTMTDVLWEIREIILLDLYRKGLPEKQIAQVMGQVCSIYFQAKAGQ